MKEDLEILKEQNINIQQTTKGLDELLTYLEDPDPGHYYKEQNWKELKYLDKTL
jgi:hypothetical protein